MNDIPAPERDSRPVGLLLRFGALLYDSLLVLAIWLVLGLVTLPLWNLLDVFFWQVQLTLNIFAAWAFFYGFWRRTGQTLGMQTWNLVVRSEDGSRITSWQATLRFLVGISQWMFILMAIHLAREHGDWMTALMTALGVLALGASALHPQRWMLHDWLSSTVLMRTRPLKRPRWKENQDEQDSGGG